MIAPHAFRNLLRHLRRSLEEAGDAWRAFTELQLAPRRPNRRGASLRKEIQST